MICSHIEKDDYIFIKLHAEQSYTNVELYKKYSLRFRNQIRSDATEIITDEDIFERDIPNIEYGVFGRKLTIKTLLRLTEYITSLCLVEKILVIDFSKLSIVQKNIYKKLHELLNHLLASNNTIVIRNIFECLYDDLKIALFQDDIKDIYVNAYLICKSTRKIDLKNLSDSLQNDAFERKLINEVGLSSVSDEELNNSSSVYLNKYIDVKKLINNKDLFAYCIYQLSIKMISEDGADWSINKDSSNLMDRKILFFQTLNGACIVSLLSDLLHVDICYVDHIGPINNLFNTCFGERIQRKRKYIVVSDVICLGTEVKIAKSLIEYNGGEYIGNLSIFRTKILKDADRNYTNIKTLFEINKDSNSKYKIDYQLKANLA